MSSPWTSRSVPTAGFQNTSFPCASLEHFSDLFNAGNLSATDLIGSCPEQCVLAWGTGNPDLSGIGVFISYSLQLAVSIILGPGLLVLHRLLDDETRQHLVTIHIVALTTTVLFASPIAIASAQYLGGTPALVDVIFIYYLNVFEFLCSWILYCTFWIAQKDKNEYKPIGRRAQTTLIFGGFLHFVMFMRVLDWIAIALKGRDSVAEFMSACNAANTTVPLPPIQTLPVILPLDTIFPQSNDTLRTFLGVLFGLSIPVMGIICYQLLKRLRITLNDRLPKSVKDFLTSPNTVDVTCALAAMGFASGMAHCFAMMHLTREQLASVARDKFTDNEWGFGQVVALFAWVPLLVEILIPLVIAGYLMVENAAGWVETRRKDKTEGYEADRV